MSKHGTEVVTTCS